MAIITTTARPATTSPLKRLIRVHPLVAYFMLAFACMWIPVLPLTLSRNAGIGLLPYDLPDVLMYVLLALTTFSGPTLAAIIVIGVTEDRQSVKQFLKRFIQWWVGLAWYLVALFIMLLIWLLGYTAVVGLPLLSGAVSHWSLLLTAFLPFVGFGILIPGIDEEPGWRGFALPRLQQRYGPFWASVILGTLHGVPTPLEQVLALSTFFTKLPSLFRIRMRSVLRQNHAACQARSVLFAYEPGSNRCTTRRDTCDNGRWCPDKAEPCGTPPGAVLQSNCHAPQPAPGRARQPPLAPVLRGQTKTSRRPHARAAPIGWAILRQGE